MKPKVQVNRKMNERETASYGKNEMAESEGMEGWRELEERVNSMHRKESVHTYKSTTQYLRLPFFCLSHYLMKTFRYIFF